MVFVPAAAWLLVWTSGGATTPAFWVAAFTCSALLIIGALYWRAVLRQIEGATRVFSFWLPGWAKAEYYSLALLSLSAIVFVSELALHYGAWTTAHIAAALLITLAALEYVNYYKFQLQHFDNRADFRRLIAGRGFRKAHLARDIAAWRSTGGEKGQVD